MKNFNENEEHVLKNLAAAMGAATGGEFGFIGEVDREGMSQHQFAGYISSLLAKSAFEFLECDGDYDSNTGQFILTEELYEKYKYTEPTKPVISSVALKGYLDDANFAMAELILYMKQEKTTKLAADQISNIRKQIEIKVEGIVEDLKKVEETS